ncbi:putative porin [Mucilaginibacter jinjuensis]|uniref:Porin n=1 Tax=Mucilaginibacter jinjuensis TaxID=1176721 RepID=A0ABY7TA13_9SPHI|nr:putative porin [Mucilaginibacter jinjuensis]WCT13063.1 putative porin [Mucilaginibacter jinjuensis]
MLKKLKYFLLLLICMQAVSVMAQVSTYPTYPGQQQQGYIRDTSTRAPAKKLTDEQMMDTLRKKEDHKKDTVIFSSKYVKVTNEHLLSDSTQVFALDTGLVNFENSNPLYQPRSPRIGLGITGLAQRPLLYEPVKSIGFDVGQHSLDPYLLNPADIQYYRARVAYTNLSLYTGGGAGQMFKLVHTQNIKPNWNLGLMFNTIGSKGYYLRQGVSDINAGLFSWYESKSKRYNMLANLLFNTLKAQENGGLQNDNIFITGPSGLDGSDDPVKLNGTSTAWVTKGLYIKQFYYLGRIDSMRKGSDTSKVLPTNRVSHTFYYGTQQYKFLQNDPDTYRVFPDYYFSSHNSRDSLYIQHLQNVFTYSFYLRGKSNSFVKNELKVDLGLAYDYYHYSQSVLDSVVNNFGAKITQGVTKSEGNFQNATLKAKLGYRFSDKMGLDADFQQVAEGYNFGDFLYDVKLNLSGGKKAGRIVLEAYSQSNKAPFVYTNWISNHYIFTGNSFSNQKTTSVSFNYINNLLRLDFKAEYFLINDYLYFAAQPGGIDATPMQAGTPISLLKLSIGKNLTWRRWHFDNYVVYQKTDNATIMRTPDLYTYSSIYYARLLFNVLNSNIGFNVRYNTPYTAPSYAVGLGQFYNGPDVTFTSYPVVSVFAKGTLFRTNLYVQYDYADQGLFSKGFYTVNRYPMFNHQLKFGVSWTFYN